MPFLRFIGFSIVRAWQGFWRNAMMSLAATATVILMLVLLSALVIVISGLNSGLEFIESKVAVTARLVDEPPEADREELIAEVQRLPGVAVGRVRVAGCGHGAPAAVLQRESGKSSTSAARTIKLFGSLEISPDRS